MRKFIQLAENVEADLKELDNDADELERRRSEGKERAKAVVNNHHRLQDRIDEGIAAMERVADVAGISRENTRTAAELAAIEEDEAIDQVKLTLSPEQFAAWKSGPGYQAWKAARAKGEHVEVSADDVADAKEALETAESPMEEPKLGEASGDTPSDATFPKAI